MLKRILKTYGRYRSDELMSALMALSPAQLISDLAKLFAAGEIRFTSKRRRDGKARNLCTKFYRYHKRNPHVAAKWFLTAARALQQQEHRKRYGIGALTERIRWDIRTGVIKTDGFKISNDVRACYARLILMRDPSLCGLFTIKPSDADGALIVDGRSWSEFAKRHYAELWPGSKKPSEPVGLLTEQATGVAR